MAGLRTFGKEVWIYGLGQTLGKCVTVLLLPLFTRIFSAEEIGHIEILTVIQTFTFSVAALGIDTALTFYVLDAQNDLEKQNRFISTGLVSILTLAILATLALIVASPLVGRSLSIPIDSAYIWAIFACPALALNQLTLKLCRIFRRPVSFAVLSLGRECVNVGLLFAALYWGRLFPPTIFVTRLAAATTVLLAGVWVFRRNIGKNINCAAFKQLLAYGAPLIPAIFVGWINNICDRYFLLRYHGAELVGIYSVANKIAMVSGVAVGAFTMAWGPFSLSAKDSPNSDKLYRTTCSVFVAFASLLALSLQICAPILVKILSTDTYLIVVPFVGIIAVAIAQQGVLAVVSLGMHISKNTKALALGSLIGVTTNIAANAILTGRYGMFGAAISALLSATTANAFVYWQSQKLYRINYDLWKIVSYFLLCLFGIYLSVLMHEREFNWFNATVQLLIFLVFSVYVLVPISRELRANRINREI